MANGHGGKRPGAGRKPKAIEERRRQNAAAILDLVSDEDRDQAFLRWWSRFEAGVVAALWVVPFVYGHPPKPKEEETGGDAVTALEIRRRDRDGGGAGGAETPV